jgi:hypothetical protein
MSLLSLRKFDTGDVILVSNCPETPPLKYLSHGKDPVADSLQRKDWYEQMKELKTFYFEISEKIITIQIPEVELSTPENIKQTLFSHEDSPKNVIVIREEQDASSLHQEIKERKEKKQISIERETRTETS